MCAAGAGGLRQWPWIASWTRRRSKWSHNLVVGGAVGIVHGCAPRESAGHRAGWGEGEVNWPAPIRGPAGFFWPTRKKAGLQWSFLKRDYCRTGQSGAKLEKRDYSSAKQKRDYISRKSGTIRRTQSNNCSLRGSGFQMHDQCSCSSSSFEAIIRIIPSLP